MNTLKLLAVRRLGRDDAGVGQRSGRRQRASRRRRPRPRRRPTRPWGPTLPANPNPPTFDAGPLGKMTVNGVVSGLAVVQ